MNHRRPKSCPDCRKHIYPNEELARVSLARLLRRPQGYNKPGAYAVKPYECPHGHGWHLGRDHNTLMINFKKGRVKNLERHPIQDNDRVSV